MLIKKIALVFQQTASEIFISFFLLNIYKLKKNSCWVKQYFFFHNLDRELNYNTKIFIYADFFLCSITHAIISLLYLLLAYIYQETC